MFMGPEIGTRFRHNSSEEPGYLPSSIEKNGKTHPLLSSNPP